MVLSANAAALALYLAACVALGWWGSRRIKSGDDYLLAGRTLGPLLVVVTLITAWTGAGSVIGGVAYAYQNGLGALWLYGDVLGILALLLLAEKIRRVGQFTTPEILERRYGPAARAAATLVTFVAYTAIGGTQTLAGGRLLEAVFGIPILQGTILFAATFILYTALGGLLGMAYVNLLQGVLMFTGLLVALVAGLLAVGGIGGLATALPDAALAPTASVTPLTGLGLLLGTGLLLVVDQSTWQRLFAARDEKTAGLSVRAFLVLIVALNALFLLLGLLARAIVPDAQADHASLALVAATLPEWLAALVYVAFAAIIMSTASAYFLSASTNLVKDVLQRFLAPTMPETRVAWASRATLVLVGVGAVALAWVFPDVISLALFSYYVYVSGIAIPLLAALTSRRATAAGAVAAIAAGFTVTLVWALAQLGYAPTLAAAAPRLFALEPVLPALAAAILAMVIGSALTPPPPRHKWHPLAGDPAPTHARRSDALAAAHVAAGAAALIGVLTVLPRITPALALLALGLGLILLGHQYAKGHTPLPRRASPWPTTLGAYAPIAMAGGAWALASGLPWSGWGFIGIAGALTVGAHLMRDARTP